MTIAHAGQALYDEEEEKEGKSQVTISGIPNSVPDLIAQGEGPQLEFKSSARWNRKIPDKDPALELAVVKTIAGFMNAEGGTLLIGVNDSGSAVGLADDLKLVPKQDSDGYVLWTPPGWSIASNSWQTATKKSRKTSQTKSWY